MRCAVRWILTFGGEFCGWKFQVLSSLDSLVPFWMVLTRDDIVNYSWTPPTLQTHISLFNLERGKSLLKSCEHFHTYVTCAGFETGGFTMAQAVRPWHLTRRPGHCPRPFHVRLVASKVARALDLLRVFRCTAVKIISPVLLTYSCIISTVQDQQFTES